MKKTVIRARSDDAVWSIKKSGFKVWLKKHLNNQASLPDSEIFCFDMEGWKLLKEKPSSYNVDYRPGEWLLVFARSLYEDIDKEIGI